ncbi:beta-N-acetylhexosaminidase [Clostridium thermarum]|uniref:beta-N-acetylhexosaminidase n=1 Tax=Clostridium thermarum TaxID=1716543 RepID=UPI0013D42242|nr:family 20 glycosylhydrolase [Clostridium thermarum]
MKTSDLIFLPYPKKAQFMEGKKLLKDGEKISILLLQKEKLFKIAKRLKDIISEHTPIKTQIVVGKPGDINFKHSSNLLEENYKVVITKEYIDIEYGDLQGAFHAVSTLKQLIVQCGRDLPCMTIEDGPDYKRRGLMVDISRDKIPTMDTLYKIIDYMADVKLNELQLYIEGFSYAYDTFTQAWSSGTPVTAEEIMLLDIYCKDRYIDLVPNQNSFGHMEQWLNRREFEHLADCPEGCLTPWGTLTRNTTLNPMDEGSVELMRKIYDDILPPFTSEYFNVGLDEPFELGHGKSKDETDKLGVGRVYLDYLMKIYNEVKLRNKRMMFWGDIIINSPELIPELPKDIIALEWGYEAEHPFGDHCEKYKAAGIDFYVCPGTSSWCTILGRTDNMKANILNAAESGLKNGAIGFLNTDWGDRGHIQYLPVSYPGYFYGAALSWSLEENRDINLEACLNRFIFKDRNELMGSIVMDLGNYYLQEPSKVSNATKLFWVLNGDIKEPEKFEESDVQAYKKVEDYLLDLYEKLDSTDMQCEDAALIIEEFKNGIKYVLHGVKRVKLMVNEIDNKENFLQDLKDDISTIMKKHGEVWLKRNRIGGLEDSLEYMRKLREQYCETT